MEAETPIAPSEVRSIFFVIIDMAKSVDAIRRILEDDDGDLEEDG